LNEVDGIQRAVARVDPGAVERNCRSLAERLTGDAKLCAVVKADGYGHGAVVCARAAIAGGAEVLAVAAANEAAELREHFPDARIFTMGALTDAELRQALEVGSEITVWREGFRALAARVAADLGTPARVHVKHDSGMGRLGEIDPDRVVELASACAGDADLELVGVWTHFATADEPDSTFFDEQLQRFRDVAERVRAEHPGCIAHAANSAAVLREPDSHFDMARCGIAIYGLDPFHRDPGDQGLEPALELTSWVADVKRFAKGSSAGYGRRWRAPADTWIGVIPVGYGDGVRRGLTNNAEVIVEGRRYPLVGTVSMDNVTIDLGSETDVKSGAEAVLIGSRDEERILAEELAERLDTINYEITCGIAPRVPRIER
jgi:alanine racemase